MHPLRKLCTLCLLEIFSSPLEDDTSLEFENVDEPQFWVKTFSLTGFPKGFFPCLLGDFCIDTAEFSSGLCWSVFSLSSSRWWLLFEVTLDCFPPIGEDESESGVGLLRLDHITGAFTDCKCEGLLSLVRFTTYQRHYNMFSEKLLNETMKTESMYR